MKITSWAIKNNRVTITILSIILIAGLLTFKSIPQSENPGFTIRVAMVMTVFPGATSERVEQLITDKIEKKIQEIPELDYVKSESKAGVSVVYVHIKDEYKNMRPIWDNLRRKIDSVKSSLPSGVYGPYVNDEFGEVFGTLISVKGKDFSYKELKTIADGLRDDLLHIPDIAKIDIIGTQDEKIFIEYNNAKLANLGIPPFYIKKLLNEQNIIIPGGNITMDGKQRILLEPSGNLESIEDIKNIIVRLPNKKEVYFLKDLVKVKRGYIDPATSKVSINGEKGLMLAISMRKGGNIIDLGKDVKKVLGIVKGNFPYGIDVDIFYFQPDVVSKAVNTFIENLLQSILIVIIVLLVSLGLRTGLLVASLIPITIIMTFLIMFFTGIGIDQVSLAALLIALGMLVDNAIVVSESILMHIKNKKSPIEAAILSTQELYKPLLIASLTTASAFLPIFLAESNVGEYTQSIFKVVTITLLSSWILSITVIPLFAVKFIKVKKTKEANESYNNFFYTFYKKSLIFILKNRLIFLVLIISLFVASLYSAKGIKQQFFPSSDAMNANIKIDMPSSTPIKRTEEVVKDIENFIVKNLKTNKVRKNGIISWASYIGESGPRYILSHTPKPPSSNFAFMLLNITNIKELSHIKAEINKYTSEKYPEAFVRIEALPMGVPVEYPVEIRVSGKNENKVYEIVDKVKSKLNTINEISLITDDWGEKALRLKVNVDQVKAYHAGITNVDVAVSLQTSLSGLDIDSYREGSDILSINLRSVASDRNQIEKIENIEIFSISAAKSVLLKQIAKIEPIYGFSKIVRRNRYRTVTVQADIKEGVVANDVNMLIKAYLDELNKNLEYGYSATLGGQAAESQKANKSIADKLPIAGLIIVLLLVIQFNSFRKPIILFTIVPLAMIGVIFGLLITDLPFGFMTLLGIVSLSGIVINNANVLMDRIRIEIEEVGLPPQEAIIVAAQKRLRPILLTTLTTVGGLTPLWLGGGPLWESMAVALIFGLTFATSITLIVVPIVYSIFHRISYKNKASLQSSPK